MSEIQELSELARAELKDSTSFFMDVTLFGAFIFAFFINLLYLAVEKDLAIKKAYYTIQNYQVMYPEEILNALRVIRRSMIGQTRRHVVCSMDIGLIELEETLSRDEQLRERFAGVLPALQQLLRRKLGTNKNWRRRYALELTRACSPFFTPRMELFLQQYAWIIEIMALIFLSQTLRKEHFRAYIYRCIKKAHYFFPITILTLAVPSWKIISLVTYEKNYNLLALLLFIFAMLIAFSAILFFLVKRKFTPQSVNNMGIYILISSLFVKFLAIMGDDFYVYNLVGNPSFRYTIYATWFILLAIPVIILDRALRGKIKRKIETIRKQRQSSHTKPNKSDQDLSGDKQARNQG